MKRRELLTILPALVGCSIPLLAKKLPEEGEVYKGWKIRFDGWNRFDYNDLYWCRWYAIKEEMPIRTYPIVGIASSCPGQVEFYLPFQTLDLSRNGDQLIVSARDAFKRSKEEFLELQEKAKRQTLERLLRFIDKNG